MDKELINLSKNMVDKIRSIRAFKDSDISNNKTIPYLKSLGKNKIDYLSYRNYNKKVVKKRKKYVIRRIWWK